LPTLIISGGLFSGAGAGSLAEVTGGADVEARVGETSTVSSNGAIVVAAIADADADADSDIGSGGLVAIGVAIPTARIGGTTRAEFSGDITLGDALSVTASATYDADATASPVTIGLIAGAGAKSLAEIQSGASVEAHIGPAVGTGGSDRPDINVGSGAVNVTADATMNATAVSDSIAGGVVSLRIMLPEARSTGVPGPSCVTAQRSWRAASMSTPAPSATRSATPPRPPPRTWPSRSSAR
jgi:hypothetical protein